MSPIQQNFRGADITTGDAGSGQGKSARSGRGGDVGSYNTGDYEQDFSHTNIISGDGGNALGHATGGDGGDIGSYNNPKNGLLKQGFRGKKLRSGKGGSASSSGSRGGRGGSIGSNNG